MGKRLTPTERAQRGAAFLDERKPGWQRKVKITRLDVADGLHCVLGQLYGDHDVWDPYMTGLNDLGVTFRKAELLGFDLPTESRRPILSIDAEFAALDEAWRDEIRARRKVLTNTGGK